MEAQNTAIRFSTEERQELSALLRRAAPTFAVALLSALMNRAPLPGGYFPLGAAFLAAVPSEYATIAAIGGVAGCLTDGLSFFASLEGLRHVSALLAVGGIRWALGELPRVNTARYYPFFTALAGVWLTGMIIHGTTGSLFSYRSLFFAVEGILAGLAAMCFVGASPVLSHTEHTAVRWHRQTAVSLLFLLCAAALPLCRWEIGRLSPGRVALHLAVLLVLPFLREVGGAVAGTAAGCVTALAEYSLYQGTVCPAAGLLAGYAARYGRILASSVYIAACLTGSLATGRFDITFAAEVTAAGVIACLVPARSVKQLLTTVGFLHRDRISSTDQTSRITGDRLLRSSSALRGVSEIVEKVSAGLDRHGNPKEEESVFLRAETRICADCACRDHCCGEGGEGETERIRRLMSELDGSRLRSAQDVSRALGITCIRQEAFFAELKEQWGYRHALNGAHRRISQVRSAMGQQLDGVALLLGELGGELSQPDRDDTDAAIRLTEALKAGGYEVIHVQCTENRHSRRSITITLRETDSTVLKRSELDAYVSECLGNVFGASQIQCHDNLLHMEFTEQPNYRLDVGTAQHCCHGGKFCGDACEQFEDGDGCGYLLLSDGMGSGGRAAVDGAMTCALFSRMLCGGFNCESTVKITNAALMLKSDEESLATVDCLRLNLLNGRAVFCKAGAAQSYHVREGVVNRIDPQSLPLGILRETDTARYAFTAEEGDLIVMLSDGVPTDESLWFEKLLEQYAGEPPQAFARFLLRRAINRRPADEDDDITVMVAVVQKIKNKEE